MLGKVYISVLQTKEGNKAEQKEAGTKGGPCKGIVMMTETPPGNF